MHLRRSVVCFCRHKSSIAAAILLLAVLAWPPQARTADDFALVQAKLVKPRDGLGNVMAKLAAGREVRVGYLGGSITAQNGWRPKTLQWLQQRYPNAKLSEINAAIGGTGSDLGVFRYEQDVLRHKPDLVFVEFAVNDGGALPESIYRSMEGIVRKTWRLDPTIDLCYVYTLHAGMKGDLDRGLCPRSASADENLADYYGIPSINVALRIVQLAGEGKLVLKGDPEKKSPDAQGKIIFAKDDCHPLDAGHEVYRDVIADGWKAMEPAAKPRPHELKKPLRDDNWENARLVPLAPAMLSGSWKKMDTEKGLGRVFRDRLPEIWEGTTPGDKITFRFRGTMVGLYDLLGPDGGQVVWTIDGQKSQPRPRFDSYCTYWRLASLRMAERLEDKEHAVTVEIQPQQPDRGSVVNRMKNEPGFDPKKFDGTRMWVGSIMMLGELVP
jgi:hypothetical protein